MKKVKPLNWIAQKKLLEEAGLSDTVKEELPLLVKKTDKFPLGKKGAETLYRFYQFEGQTNDHWFPAAHFEFVNDDGTRIKNS